MSKSIFKAGWRGVLGFLVLCSLLGAPATASAGTKPYVETTPKRGFHPFNRPKKKEPAAQWEYVQGLERQGKIKAAANQSLALRTFWPHSAEAPESQMLHARLLQRRLKLQPAFDAYQYLIEHYTGHFEFDVVLEQQMQIAKTLMEQRKGKFLFLPGFTAPERAIPLFEKIVASAPEWRHTAEAFYLIGTANERIYEYDKAIDAYFTVMNRFPDSDFAEKSAYAQAQCHIQLSKDAPNDNRALSTARAACDLFLQRYPDSTRRALIEADLARIRGQQMKNAYALATYYDSILRKPAAALIEYKEFVALYPEAPQAAEARLRIAKLQSLPEK